MFVIRRTKDKLFYNSNTLKWVELAKARVFKTKAGAYSFIRYHHNKICSFEKRGNTNMVLVKQLRRDMVTTTDKQLKVIEVELKIRGVV